MRRLGLVSVTALIASALAIGLQLTAQAEGAPCEWLAGDFHVHTVYSHDAYGGPQDPGTGPDEFYTFGWTPGQQGAIAESRNLDFIAITDHDNVDAYLDREGAYAGIGLYESGWGRTNQIPGGDPLIWVPDYEANVSGAGHAQMHGATHFYPKQSPQEMASALHNDADAGAFQINHPGDIDWHVFRGDEDEDGEQDYDEFDYEFPGFAPDALEIWNIGVWAYHPPFPATNDHEFPVLMYNDFLDEGFKVAATGGSDNHWRSTTAAQGVGQPTTWVCAEKRTYRSIIDGVLAGRTHVSHQPPAYMGATAKLFADGDGDGNFEAMLGDTVTLGEETKIRAVVENAAGATWVRAEVFYPDGIQARRELQPLCEMSNQLFGPEPESSNAYCENRLAMLAMTSPIYFEVAEFDPTTTLTYDGPTQVRAGDIATLSARLLDSTGIPLPNQAVTFTFRGKTYAATTDALGRGAVEARVSG
ncbi:MAG: CehA/McbA family metallohydrolase, partial [Actinomycetota bacterium]